MITLIKNGLILTMTEEHPVISGDLMFINDRITFIGDRASSPEFSAIEPDKVIDASGGIVMPGLVNAHCHLSMVLLRNFADDLDLFTWLRERIWPIEAKLTPDHIRIASLLGSAELIRGGVTTFSDMYFHQQQTCEAVAQAGIRARIGATFFGDGDATRSRLPAMHLLARSWHQGVSGRIQVDAAPHAIYTCTDETLRLARTFADEYDTRMQIHLSETSKEVADAFATHGVSPVRHIEMLGLLERPVYAAHCVHVSDEDIRILCDNRVTPIHNPTSNMKLGSGFAPIPAFLRAGLRPALGTDGASSNNNLDMFEEIHLASIIHKGYTGDPTAVTAWEALCMATIDGARAVGLDREIGSLEVGKKADIIIADTSAIHLNPLNDPISAVAYSMKSSDISHVFCDGNHLLNERELMTVDVPDLMEHVSRCTKTLLSSNEPQRQDVPRDR